MSRRSPALYPARLCLATALALGTLPALAQTTGSAELGAGYLDRDAWRFGSFAGVNDKGYVPFLDFSLQARPAPDSDERWYWQIDGERLGLDTARLAAEAGETGRQRLRFDWRRIASFHFDDARTPVRGIGSASLNLPAGWQAEGPTTRELPRLQEQLTALNLWQRRHSLRLDYQYLLHPAWTLRGEVRQERVDGTRLLGAVTGATGGNSRAALLPAPVDYDTSMASVGLAYASSTLHWHLGYQASLFNNGARALQWPTLYGQHPQWSAGTGFPDGQNQLALEPDNQAHQLNTGGSWVLSPTQRLHLDAALGRQRQNERFLPYTVNSALLPAADLPRDSLQGRVDTARLDLRLHSRLSPRLNVNSHLSYRDRDNRTAQAAFQRVRGDAVPQQALQDARVNRPYGLRQTSIGVDASYHLPARLRLESGLEQQYTERTFSETHRLRETTAKIGLRGNAGDTVVVAGELRHQQRRSDNYVANRPYIRTHLPGRIGLDEFENHPLLRRYYLTERDRDQARLQGSWQALPALNVGANLAWSRDDYPDGFFGLHHSTQQSATLDFSYTLSQQLRLNGFWNRDRYRNTQSGRSFRGSVPADAWDPARDWQMTASDRFDTWGLGLMREALRLRLGAWQAPGSLDLELQFSHSRSTGQFDGRTGSALNSAALPELGTTLASLDLSARYAWSARSSLRLAFIHERYRSQDFALDGVGPATVASVLLPGMAAPHYRANWLTLAYRHDF